MVTDPLPRTKAAKERYARSDVLLSLTLPSPAPWRAMSAELERALKAEKRKEVQAICNALSVSVAQHFDVRPAPIAVLGVRPHRTADGRCVYEKYGDYNLKTSDIRVWMRTAMQHKVTSFGTLLSTLCHEFCHHLDVVKFGLPETYHTRGFYERAGLLYHHVRGTPRRPLVWSAAPRGIYRIDWGKTMKSVPLPDEA